jgi:hypothetical protein
MRGLSTTSNLAWCARFAVIAGQMSGLRGMCRDVVTLGSHIMADWSRHFDEPIAPPDGGELRTLLDAGRYVDKLPRSMHEREEWQTVMELLLSAVEGRESVRLVQVALTLALQESNPRRKPVKKHK